MAITEAAPGVAIASTLWNEIAGLTNGTTGLGNPVRHHRYNDPSAYSVVNGNADTLNGLAWQAQYGDPASPTIIAQANAADGLYVNSFLTLKYRSVAPAGPASAVRIWPDTQGIVYIQRPGQAGAAIVDATTSLPLLKDGRNRIMNGDANFWANGVTFTTDNQYGPDGAGIRLLLGAANAAILTRETTLVPTGGSRSSFKLTVGSGNNNKFGMFFPIESVDMWDLRGSAVSIGATIEATAGLSDLRMALVGWFGTADATTGDPVSAWNTAGTNPTLAGSWAYLSTPTNSGVTTAFSRKKVENTTVSDTATNLAVFVWCDDTTSTQTTDHFEVTDIQLEYGATANLFERRTLGEGFCDVRRYFQAFAAGIRGEAYSTTAVLFGGTFATPMRAAPTLVLADTSIDISEPGVGTQTSSGSAIVAQATSLYDWAVQINGFLGLTAKDAVYVTQAGTFLTADVRI